MYTHTHTHTHVQVELTYVGQHSGKWGLKCPKQELEQHKEEDQQLCSWGGRALQEW